MTTASDTTATDRDAGLGIIALSRRYLREYLTKIRLSVSVLDDHVVWARPNEASNSIGNLMLHLAGNARQWIVSGVGGTPDVRDRQSEFEQRASIPVTVLEAVFHVVEHFSMHTGQIILLAKADQADRVRFYDMVDGHPRLISDFHGRTPVHPR